MLDLVEDIFHSEHQRHHFFQADFIEDILLLFVIRLEVLSDIHFVSKFCLRQSRPLAVVNSALRVDSSFLQDLSVDLWVLVKVIDFLQ